MKKIFLSILSILYLASSVGATIHLHYCMDKFVASGLAEKEDDSCENCGMKKDGSCCKDEHKFIRNTVDQKTTESASQVMQVIATGLPNTFPDNHQLYISSLINKYAIAHAPPLHDAIGLNVLNCVFRI